MVLGSVSTFMGSLPGGSDPGHDHHHEHAHDYDHEDGDEDEQEHGHEEPDPITERMHDNSWSANLEEPRYADDHDQLIADAVTAIEHTTAGHHLNLVTHGDHGHPAEYLYDALETAAAERERDWDWDYIEQCGCGGHVTRVSVRD